eukprot:TRINITY_DN3892_c0_g1_i1.p1 TRINITY_DN3892_c0_g1~~TRINITY_DN3892_c0_g1_i1.p1  ORF type:complete len:818 (-),score=330.40 TRINITY_DN3892_c0_g1_i1:7-2460(-)
MVSIPGPKGPRKLEFGVIHDFAFQVEGGGEIIVSTTRPETMLGDEAVAIHPQDERYVKFHGKFIVHPLTQKKIPIVTDAILADPNIGTGAVKVTPAHDAADLECGKRHSLPVTSILNEDGTLNHLGMSWEGKDRLTARSEIVTFMNNNGFYRGKKNHPMRIGFCSRTGDVLEPMLKPQWFVKTKPLAENAIQLVQEGHVTIQPEFQVETWNRWLKEGRDWCISRQLWWGHQIPAYRVKILGNSGNSLGNSGNNSEKYDGEWIVAKNKEEAEKAAMAKFNLNPENFQLEQDEDVLDTWFSSGLLPLSSLGLPNSTFNLNSNLKKFYPLDVMETGSDILFFWVARMTMLCSYLHPEKQFPFRKIWLHPMVRDSKGRKMSKSLGNVIDPRQVMDGATLDQMKESLRSGNLDSKELEKSFKNLQVEFPNGIPPCGSDALRFTLISYTSNQDRSINMEIDRVHSIRKFCNKMWNAARYVLDQLEVQLENGIQVENTVQVENADLSKKKYVPVESLGTLGKIHDEKFPIMERWILHRVNETVKTCRQSFENFNLEKATSSLLRFFLDDFCDVYLEFSKHVMYRKYNLTPEQHQVRMEQTRTVLYHTLEIYLRLLHPFMPFLSEELWHRLPHQEGSVKESLMIAPYPVQLSSWIQHETEPIINDLNSIISTVRGIRKDFGIPKTYNEEIFLLTDSPEFQRVFSEFPEDLALFCKSSAVTIKPTSQDFANIKRVERTIDHRGKIIIPLPGNIVDFSAESQKVEKRIAKLKTILSDIQKTMKGETYLVQVESSVQEANKEREGQLLSELSQWEDALKILKQFSGSE